MKTLIIWHLIFFIVNLSAQQTNTDDYNKFLLAQSYEQQNDFDKARQIYEELYQKNPTNINYFNSLNRVYIQQKNFASSILIIESRLKNYPNDISLIGQLGSTYYMSGDYKTAYQIWDEPLKNDNTDKISFRIIANCAIERRAFDKAIEILEKGKPKTDDPFIFSMDLANLYSLTMRYDKAAEEYCAILEKFPNQLAVIQNRILSYINKPDALQSTINVVEKKIKTENTALLFLLARLYTEQKVFDKAFEIYTDLDYKQQSNGADLYNFAEFVFREGEYEIALSIFRAIVERYPDTKIIPSVKFSYAKSQEAILRQKFLSSINYWKTYSLPLRLDSETVEPAVSAFREITQIYSHSEAAIESYLRMAQIKFRLQYNLAEAKEILQIVIENYPTSRFAIDAYLDAAEINLMEGNVNKSAELYEEALNLPFAQLEKKNEAHFYISKIKAYDGEFNEARKHLSEIIKNLKDNFANDALELLLLLNNSKNDSSNLLLFSEAEILAERMLFKEAQNKYDMIAADPKAFMFHSISKLRSAQMEIAQDDYNKAISKLNEIVEEKEKNIYPDKALYLLGNIFEFALKEIPRAIDTYERLLLQFPESIYIEKARERIQILRKTIS